MPRRLQPDPLAEKLGGRITQLREEQRLTLENLAHKCGVGKGHLSNIERGLTRITIQTLFRIAEGLGMPVARLVVFPGESERDTLIDLLCRLPPNTLHELVERVRKEVEREQAKPATDHGPNGSKPREDQDEP